jgi:hypothetical protein
MRGAFMRRQPPMSLADASAEPGHAPEILARITFGDCSLLFIGAFGRDILLPGQAAAEEMMSISCLFSALLDSRVFIFAVFGLEFIAILSSDMEGMRYFDSFDGAISVLPRRRFATPAFYFCMAHAAI